jgi:hypothetical protein
MAFLPYRGQDYEKAWVLYSLGILVERQDHEEHQTPPYPSTYESRKPKNNNRNTVSFSNLDHRLECNLSSKPVLATLKLSL